MLRRNIKVQNSRDTYVQVQTTDNSNVPYPNKLMNENKNNKKVVSNYHHDLPQMDLLNNFPQKLKESSFQCNIHTRHKKLQKQLSSSESDIKTINKAFPCDSIEFLNYSFDKCGKKYFSEVKKFDPIVNFEWDDSSCKKFGKMDESSKEKKQKLNWFQKKKLKYKKKINKFFSKKTQTKMSVINDIPQAVKSSMLLHPVEEKKNFKKSSSCSNISSLINPVIGKNFKLIFLITKPN